jgi:hypothetical protein
LAFAARGDRVVAAETLISRHIRVKCALQSGRATPGRPGPAPYRAGFLPDEPERRFLMQAPSVKLFRFLWAGALVPAAVLLSSCSDNAPVSPTAVESQDPSFAGRTHPKKVLLQVAHTARLRPPTTGFPLGYVEIEVRVWCPRPYVRQESGLLRIEQGVVSGEGSVQLQLGGCSGTWQSGITKVEPFGDVPFRRGRARVSFQFDVVNPNDEDVLTASVNQRIKIR